MSEVLSIRIPKELKRRMERLRNIVDWRREIIEFLEERIKYYERREVLMRLRNILQRHPELPSGIALRFVREDRDSH